MRNVEVTSCFECPFFHPTDYSVNDPMHCWITEEVENTQNPTTFLPNCPLKEGKVVVEIKTQKEENKNG